VIQNLEEELGKAKAEVESVLSEKERLQTDLATALAEVDKAKKEVDDISAALEAGLTSDII
jgi:phage shock protein A